jgi:hypothetical protein
MPALREAIREIYMRLFPEPVVLAALTPMPEQNSDHEAASTYSDEDDPPLTEELHAKKQDYRTKLSKMFDDALNAGLGASRQVNI